MYELTYINHIHNNHTAQTFTDDTCKATSFPIQDFNQTSLESKNFFIISLSVLLQGLTTPLEMNPSGKSFTPPTPTPRDTKN